MADEKLNTSPKDNKPPEATAPPGQNVQSALESVKSPGDPPGHEQAVILGMGKEAPAPAGKVIDLSGIKAVAAHNGKLPIAPDVADKPPEGTPDQKRRGRPPKEQAGPTVESRADCGEKVESGGAPHRPPV